MNRIARVFAVVGCATGLSGVLVGGLAGCGDTPASERAVRGSANKLHALTGGGGSAPTPGHAKKAYSEVLAANQGDAPASGSLLASHAHFGLAEEPYRRAVELESRAKSLGLEALTKLNAWVTYQSMAAAADTFDPTAALAKIVQDKDAGSKVAAAASEELSKLKARQSALQSQIEAKSAEAKRLSEQASALRDSAAKVSAVEATPIIEQAAAVRRQADEAIKTANLIKIESDQLLPQIAEAELTIKMVANQTAKLDEAAAGLRARKASSQSEAAAHRAKATESAQAADAAITEWRELRSGDLAKALDEAASKLNAAKSAGAKAGGETMVGGRMMQAQALQTLGDLHAARADGLREFAQVLATLAKAQPTLPKAAAYKEESAQAEEAATKALQEAQASYEEAASAFAKHGVRSGDVRDRLERVTAALNKRAGKAADDAETPADAPAPEAAAPAPTADASGLPADLLAFLEGFVTALREGRFEDTVAMTHAGSPAGEKALAGMVGFAKASYQLDQSLRAKFGKGVEAVMGGPGEEGMGMGSADFSKLQTLKVADLEAKAQGDRGTFTDPLDGSNDGKLIKIDGQWKVDASEDLNNPMAGMMMTMLDTMTRTMRSVTADVDSGKLTSLDEVKAAFEKAMMELMGGMADPSGGPK